MHVQVNATDLELPARQPAMHLCNKVMASNLFLQLTMTSYKVCSMKLFTVNSTAKKFMLPLILAVAVFFVTQGIELPNFNDLLEPQLSLSQKSNGFDNAVVKTLTKCSHVKSVKNVNFFALLNNAFQINSPVVPVTVFQHQSQSFVSSVVSIIPARAPPA